MLPRRPGAITEQQLVRAGWDKHGARSRLDRRRTVKEAIKRRAVQEHPVPFANEDLRFRQLLQRPLPSFDAVVFLVLDVSASMGLDQRRLAKTFFFLALQGLRRSYARVDTRFIAHTTRAWTFSESDFFQVHGMGGTMASSAFRLCRQLLAERHGGARDNAYLFYASDGENFSEDRNAASVALGGIGKRVELHGLCGNGDRHAARAGNGNPCLVRAAGAARHAAAHQHLVRARRCLAGAAQLFPA